MYTKHGWWFPDEDTHFCEMLDKNIAKGNQPVYQEPVRKRSLIFVNNRKLALDIGANIGLWSRDLCNTFESVIAFEPVESFRKCLKRNVHHAALQIEECALGETDTTIEMIITPGNTGHSHVDQTTVGSGSIPMRRLDSLNLQDIGYIKIDCEGYELPIIRGAEETIKRCRPVMVVEQKLHEDTGKTRETQFDAAELIKSWGAKELARVRHDVILGW
jgi:FkbM family methyltransferase